MDSKPSVASYPNSMEYDSERPSPDYPHNVMPLAQTGVAMIDNDEDEDRFQDEYLSKANNGNSSSSPPNYATTTVMSTSNSVVVLTSSDVAPPAPTATTTVTTNTTSRKEKRDWANATERTGCCCDLRRAVIIVNMLGIVVIILFAIVFGIATSDKAREAIYDDDVTLNELQITMDLTGRDKLIIYLFFLFLIFLMTMGILGAKINVGWYTFPAFFTV
jgi:hypothetical protein